MSTIQTGKYRVLILGAGITGLSSALRIQESRSDVHVTIMAEKFTPHTCSDGSAGFVEPISTGSTDPTLVNTLATETYNYLLALALSPLAKTTGIQQVSGYQAWVSEQKEDQKFTTTVGGWRRMTKEELASFEGAKSGRFFTSLSVDVTPHLQWLTDRFLANGGRLIQRKINSLDELSSEWHVVVNCTGIGSRELLGDKTLYPVRGQVFRVHAPWIKHFCLFDRSKGGVTELTYILPNFDSVVLGGVFQKDNWNKDVDKKDAEGIWERVTAIFPSLKEAKVLGQWVGLRPVRDPLRLESEVIEIGPEKRHLRMVHNYGHGGAGITVHWGCAREVSEMVTKFLPQHANIVAIPQASSRSKL